jgi:hypothetical protein
MMSLVLLLVFAAVVAGLWFQGLWNCAVTLINLFLAMMIATNFYEPICTLLETSGAGSFTYLLDFAILWILFAISFGLLRAITDALSSAQVKFDLPVEMIGRSLLAVWCAWLFVCFAAFSLQMAPLNSATPLGAWASPSTGALLNADRLWLGFMHSRSKGALAGHAFDENAEFLLKYHDRRDKYAKATDMRVPK